MSELSNSLADACAAEPIHIPGAIQPHGMLLTFREEDLECLQVSANWGEGHAMPAEEVPGRALPELFPEKVCAALQRELSGGKEAEHLVTLEMAGRPWVAVLHRHDGVVVMELEPASGPGAAPLHRGLKEAMAAIREAPGLPVVLEEVAQAIQKWTGFSRVMIYQFDEDWHGQVVAESLSGSSVDSYLGHHFPATDIPEQARALYTKNWIRVIPNSTYTPVPLIPQENPCTRRPLDLSFSILRSVSPVHLEYLRNMDVGASMSVSLITDGRLWGLIACHHEEARTVPFPVRSACELLGQHASLEIALRTERRTWEHRAAANRIQTRFFDVLAKEQNFAEALVKYTPDLLQFMGAGGAVLYLNDRITRLGEVPGEPELTGLIAWLRQQDLDPLFATDSLQTVYPPAADWAAHSSGLLAVRLSPLEFQVVLFFRPEVITTVTWAGNPRKPVEEDLRLHPRKSFASWVETVRGHSLPWTSIEKDGALELRSALNALVLRRTETLISSNEVLEKRNSDLQSFAYIASHDLKEPLRGIAQYSTYIQEDYGPELPAEALEKLRTIHQLATHSSLLLEALSRFSRIGRMELHRQNVPGDELLDGVLLSIRSTLEVSGLQVLRPAPLPMLNCDPVLAREVFSNLILNAAKYNTSPQPWVRITSSGPVPPDQGPSIHISDNGIGIAARHQESIFHMFRRLHAHDAYGGGTGAGLAIVKSIVERHGGRVSLESVPGAGATFSFSFG